jgi:hypothetical protein
VELAAVSYRRIPLRGDESPPAPSPLRKIAKWTAIVMAAMWLLDNPWRETLR